MARPAKSTKVLTDYSQTKDEIKARTEMEEKLKGKGLPEFPEWLTERQKNIFNAIIDCLKDSGMLCINDVWILTKAAIAIDRIEYLEKSLNNADTVISDNKDVLAAIKMYTGDFYRACNELCLSPQSRAKLANVATVKDKEKPLEKLIAKASEI